MKRIILFTVIFLTNSCYAAQRQNIPADLQTQYSRILKRLDPSENPDATAQAQAYDLIERLRPLYANAEIQALQELLPKGIEYIPAEIDQTILCPGGPNLSPEAQEATRLHTKMKEIKDKKQKDADELGRKLFYEVINYDDDSGFPAENEAILKRIQDFLDQGADYFLKYGTLGSAWFQVFYPHYGNRYTTLKKLFEETEKKRKQQKEHALVVKRAKAASKITNEILDEISPGSMANGNISNIIEGYLVPAPDEVFEEEKKAQPSKCVIS